MWRAPSCAASEAPCSSTPTPSCSASCRSCWPAGGRCAAERAARVADRRLVVLLRLVGLALPAADDRLDDRRLLRRPRHRPRPLAAPAAASCSSARSSTTWPSWRTSSTSASSSTRMDGIATAVGAPVDVPALQVVLPIGISFYTFNSMSYTIDVYRGRVRPTRERAPVHGLRRALPASRRGADRPLQRHRAPAAPPHAATDVGRRRRRPLLPRVRARQEAARRRHARSRRRPPVRVAGDARLRGRLDGGDRLLAPALLRLLRLLGHGRGARAARRLPLPPELQLAVQGAEHLGLLAPLAHDALGVDPRLPVHPAGRLAPRPAAHASPCWC